MDHTLLEEISATPFYAEAFGWTEVKKTERPMGVWGFPVGSILDKELTLIYGAPKKEPEPSTIEVLGTFIVDSHEKTQDTLRDIVFNPEKYWFVFPILIPMFIFLTVNIQTPISASSMFNRKHAHPESNSKAEAALLLTKKQKIQKAFLFLKNSLKNLKK